MNILIFGSGVIGTTYAWQLHEAGHQVSMLVRKLRMVRYSHSGVPITYTDMRDGKKSYGQTVFRPKIVERLDPSRPFDLIVVTVRSHQLGDVIPYLAKYSGDAHILFLGNMWEETKLIKKHLPKGRYFFGYPGMVAGGHLDNGINTYLFRQNHTWLGEPSGKKTDRLLKVIHMLDEAGMRPRPFSKMEDFLRTQYLMDAVLPGLLSKAGSARLFARNKILIKQYIMALREGQRVCRKLGVKTTGQFPFNRLHLPVFLLNYMVRRSLTNEVLAAMDAHLKHGPNEKKKQYLDILHTGKRLKVPMPYWASFEKYMDFS